MWHVPNELHDISLRFMRHLMHLFVLTPPRNYLYLKLLYSTALFLYISVICSWRFFGDYSVVYDVRCDHLSHFLDFANFAALITGHALVSLDLLWRNCSDQIEQQLQRIRHELRLQFRHKVNLQRIESHCNFINRLILSRMLLLLATSVYNSMQETHSSVPLMCNFYSEIIFTLRCGEFTLHSTLVLAFYKELLEAGQQLVQQLNIKWQQMSQDERLLLQQLSRLQHMHQSLWQIQRDIECNFERSLTLVMLKYFVDASVLPYWVYLNIFQNKAYSLQLWCVSEEIGKLLEVIIPCWICTRCDYLQRKLRSQFHGVSTDRSNEDLNIALLRISSQLAQERCQFRIGGLITINHEMLGRFLFGVVSYIFICVQFRINFYTQEADDFNVKRLHNLTATSYLYIKI
ncbi:hypothetical protein KR044_009829 [Drosophila immigrans]|nr:hypothetical protein KR044_009829 [Drosophila immigrans]